MKFEMKRIGPSQASKWLEANIENNRNVSQSVVNAYARDMKAGNWRLTHQAICFDKKKNLIDGQHRLWAIIEAGCEVEMWVATDADPEILPNIDQMKARSIKDVLTLTGQKPSPDLVAVANRMRIGLTAFANSMTSTEMTEFLEMNRAVIDQARALFPNKGKGTAQSSVKAVIARALLTVPADRVERFVHVLTTGFMGEGEEVIIILRDAILSDVKKLSGFEVYAKTSRALKAFLERESIKSLYAATYELFPLPVDNMLSCDRPVKPRKQAAG